MINEVVTGTNIIYYLMAAVGVIGILAKVVNHITLRRMLGAASNMSKSTHKLMKLVRAKYEHACMLHDNVENTEAFVDKYIYEYKGNIFRMHTWRQLEIQSVWISGLLAAAGAFAWYLEAGFCEQMFQYIVTGVAEMILLYVVGQLSDEDYKIRAVKMYMVDYLENVCVFRYRRQRRNEKEQIDVIPSESTRTASDLSASGAAGNAAYAAAGSGADMAEYPSNVRTAETDDGSGLSINIEGQPRKAQRKETVKQVFHRASRDKPEEEDESVLKEEKIRQILEEFLA